MKRQTRNGEQVEKGFEDLKAWQLARRLMIECHKVADGLPAKERYDLNGYIAYVRKLRAGSDLYGDKFFPAPEDQPAPAESQPLS